MSFEEFLSDDRTSSAVVRKFEIIGEASKNIAPILKKKYNNVPWNDMVKMRDKVAHAYFVVDYEIVWKTLKESLPDLREKIQKIVEKETS